jgi:hypothetical protein
MRRAICHTTGAGSLEYGAARASSALVTRVFTHAPFNKARCHERHRALFRGASGHDAQRHVLTLGNWGAKANQEVTRRVKVPVEALMTGTPSRTARVSGATRNPKEAVGKLPARGTRIAYEASARWARGPLDSKPDVIRIEPAYTRRVYGRKVTRLTLRDLSACLRARFVGRPTEGTAEVSRGHSSDVLTVAKVRTGWPLGAERSMSDNRCGLKVEIPERRPSIGDRIAEDRPRARQTDTARDDSTELKVADMMGEFVSRANLASFGSFIGHGHQCVNQNRRVRNRTHGGVGGRRGQPRLLPTDLRQPGLVAETA